MPFTFSHPAAVLPLLPLNGGRVSATALVIGSMAPDFEFFFRMRAETDISHNLPGAFLFNIPVTVVLAFVYHGWVRSPLLHNLPPFLKRRVGLYDHFKWSSYLYKHWVVVLVSALIGVASHFFCDAFTHDYGWFVHRIPALASTFALAGKNVPVYHALQYLSSLVLGVIILFALLKLPKQGAADKSGSAYLYWGITVGAASLALGVRIVIRGRELVGDDLIMSVIGSGIIGVIISSTVFRWMVKDSGDSLMLK